MAYRIPRSLKEWIPNGVSAMPTESFEFLQAAFEYRGHCLHKNDPRGIAKRGYRPTLLLPDWELRRMKESRDMRMACIRAALAAMGK